MITNTILTENDTKRTLHQKHRIGTRFRETVITNAVLTQIDAKRTLHQKRRFLKRLSIFLTKCKIAMKNVSYMCVLDHAPNMQAVVSELPPNLQNKWRDQAAKRKRTSLAPASFTDIAEFVESASDSANYPVFG